MRGDLADATISIGNRIGKRQAAATPHAAAGWHAPGTVQARVSLTSKEPLEHQQYGVISSTPSYLEANRPCWKMTRILHDGHPGPGAGRDRPKARRQAGSGAICRTWLKILDVPTMSVRWPGRPNKWAASTLSQGTPTVAR